MTTIVIQAFNGDELKAKIDALGATSITTVLKIKNGEFLVIYS